MMRLADKVSVQEVIDKLRALGLDDDANVLTRLMPRIPPPLPPTPLPTPPPTRWQKG